MGERLGELQAAIMRVLWDRGCATVAEIHEVIKSRRPVAYTTISTVLRRMEARSIVAHRTEGRTYVYQPVMSEDQIGSSVVNELVKGIFGGRASQLVSYLLESDEVGHDELARVKKLIRQYEKRQAGIANKRRNKR